MRGRLVELGVISFQDSPNGKRWGRRDADGRIVEAYGFDLSPLSARVEEFEELHAELQAERELCQRLKRQITVARRMIRATDRKPPSAALCAGPGRSSRASLTSFWIDFRVAMKPRISWHGC